MGGYLPEPSQKHNLWMKQALCRSQNHSRLHSHLPPAKGSLAACLGGNNFLYSNFRIILSFIFSHPLPATFPHSNFWNSARCYIEWVRQEVVYCYTTSMFSHFLSLFFLLTSSFAAKSLHPTLPANRHGHLLPQGPPLLTTVPENQTR
jgi:hypothetical protein